MTNFDDWYKRVTEGEIPQSIDMPTGMGKTTIAVLGWLWRRRFHR